MSQLHLAMAKEVFQPNGFLIRMSIDEFAIFQVSSRQRQQQGAEKTHEEEDVEEDVEGDVEEDGEEEWWKLPNWGTYFQ